ncbi:hypothetical protein [Paucisalibacillus globulus]|uniref:hypothetical protein n=1 Tax=Paucisalibacillus globulus TaxID=351095 RepID=UPI0003F92354|nr:hypothetical protein [Paucisalibacillus globulus]
MKVKMKIVIALSVVSLVTITFLISAQSYFNNKEISFASDRCYEKGGMPKIESDFFTLKYSFSCQDNN